MQPNQSPSHPCSLGMEGAEVDWITVLLAAVATIEEQKH